MPGTKLQEHIGSEKAWVWSAVDFADESQKMELFCIRFASKDREAPSALTESSTCIPHHCSSMIACHESLPITPAIGSRALRSLCDMSTFGANIVD